MAKPRTWWSFVFLFFCLVLLERFAAFSAQAQTTRAASRNSGESDPATFGIFEANTVANARVRGIDRDRRLTLIGLSYELPLKSNDICSIRFVPEIIPVGLLSEPFLRGTNIQASRSVPPLTENKLLYGMGASPIALEFAFLPQKRVHPFLSSHLGLLYFNRNALAEHAAQFNFTVDGRIGAQIRSRNGSRVLSVGYMFQHTSNAFTARQNPGVDPQMIVVAYNFAFH